MNILIIPSWYPNTKNPLIGSFFREQAISLQKSGHNVVVLNATYLDKSGYFDFTNFKLKLTHDEGMKVYSYITPSFGIVRNKRLLIKNFQMRINRIFKRIISEDHIDIIHAHSYMPAGYCACKLGDMYNIPVIVTEHSSKLISNNISDNESFYLRKCIESSEYFICVSEGLKNSIIQLTGTKKNINVIPNMLSPIFNYEEKRESLDEFIFCSVGNLIDSKRFGLTINAFTKAFKNKRNIKLKVIGGGPLLNKLNKQIHTLGMSDQITMYGRTSRTKVVEHMQNSDVFVLPSLFETFGIVYIEALACGKPVIATKNGGAEEIVNEENGILIEIDEENQLSEAMMKMVNDYNHYIKQEISEKTIKKYGEKTVAERLTVLYERCINR